MLEHLIVAPVEGLCNRMRVIASARRLCRRCGARLSIIWDWGEFTRFFAPLPDADVVRLGSLCQGRRDHFKNGEGIERRVDVRQNTVKTRTCHVFWGNDEPRIKMWQLRDYFPKLSPPLAAAVDRFASGHFASTVGMHIRRSDNRRSIARSPDELFRLRARAIVAADMRIFLATDNALTEQQMRGEFGDAIITYPKRDSRPVRWPRRFDPIALEDDLIDLFLLARSQYVLGSSGSSFSSVAIVLNGSPRSEKLKLVPGEATEESLGQPDDSAAAA
ncbi:MAG: hypothetical protein L0211_19655 [Planctomycetaceae bacterium]|nr:hypothetical protein [Planctomycetaceae bacterium]